MVDTGLALIIVEVLKALARAYAIAAKHAKLSKEQAVEIFNNEYDSFMEESEQPVEKPKKN